VQVQLPQGQTRTALGMQLRFEGVRAGRDGKDIMAIAVNASGRQFEAMPRYYWSEFNQGVMKKPHVERFLLHDVYISPLEMAGDQGGEDVLWLAKGETRTVGEWTYTFVDFDRQMGDVIRVAARLRARRADGAETPVRPQIEIAPGGGAPNRIPGYLPGGASVMIEAVDAAQGRVGLTVPGMGHAQQAGLLAVEVSTKPLINLVWLGAILMLGSAFLSVVRRWQDLSPRLARGGVRASEVVASRAGGPAPQGGGAAGR
jgi:cytochrome c-type biogenesis protein CcmF